MKRLGETENSIEGERVGVPGGSSHAAPKSSIRLQFRSSRRTGVSR